MGTKDTLQTLKHTDKEVSSYLKNLSGLNVDNSYYLTVLAGENRSAKKKFMDRLKKQSDEQLEEIDLRKIVSTVMEETTQKIDQMIENLGSAKYVWLHHGDQLGGVYTGYSFSVRRYATPQERYLLKKMAGSEKLFFLDLEDIHTVNNLMRRHAQTLITFEQSTSFLGKLKQITVHGSSFASNRKSII